MFDDFLPVESLRQIQTYFTTEPFTYVKSQRSRSYVFRHLDGDPLVGTSVFHHYPDPPKNAKKFPSGNSVDLLVHEIDQAAEFLSPWTGKQGESWDFFTCTPYVYPLGAGLSWHDDVRGGKSASYTFYAHAEWSASWGAELLIESRGRQGAAGTAERKAGGFGNYITPLPNRLVVIKAGTPHMVKRVEMNAGEHVRASLTGFFYTNTE
ncbi:2OG-Fe(II) oxygenase [Streptomyces sp. NRRL S-1022]|uniref:2OG-Fe(II) oxygenase n=1 Tax=Streptomyces sp. NRRL S-1022 TaxID=1463880 RepID=UPI00131A6FE3|nr:2OG-Fe(II) oxygenase [Streptomyces sp. NRRL S-1022]